MGLSPRGHPGLEKWSGRLDSNQRPLRPSGPVPRFYATSCGERSSFKSLVQRRLWSQAIAGDSSKALHGRNPNATPRTPIAAVSTAYDPLCVTQEGVAT
jgi:hypothetical protein